MDYAYQPSKDRICAFSYVNEKDLPEGEKLLQCSKCSETFYRDRASQVSHWPLHKRFCCSIEKESRLLKEDWSDVEDFKDILHNPLFTILQDLSSIRKGQSRVIVHLFQQLRKLLVNNPMYFDSTKDDIGFFLVEYVFMPLRKMILHNRDRLALWAIPGFANFFLSEELFLSNVMLERKRNGTPALTDEEYDLIDHYFHDEEDVLEAQMEFPGLILPPAYTGLLMKVLLDSFLDIEPETMTGGQPKTDSLGVAIARLVFRSWACPYTRVSYASLPYEDKDGEYGNVEEMPWEWASRSGCVSEFLASMYDVRMPTEPGEIVPGLSAKSLLTTMVEDASFFAFGNVDAIRNFLHRTNFNECQDPDKGPLCT